MSTYIWRVHEHTHLRIVELDLKTSHAVRPLQSVVPQTLSNPADTLFPSVGQCIPTVVDNAYSQGLLEAYEIGISFTPSRTPSEMNGELTFGGIDEGKYKGSLNYV